MAVGVKKTTQNEQREEERIIIIVGEFEERLPSISPEGERRLVFELLGSLADFHHSRIRI